MSTPKLLFTLNSPDEIVETDMVSRKNALQSNTGWALQRQAWARMFSGAVNKTTTVTSGIPTNTPVPAQNNNIGSYGSISNLTQLNATSPLNPEKVEFDDALRKKYILYSGALNTFDNSYTQDSRRPQPGLTGIQTEHKGNGGPLTKTTVNFQCWTREDLEALEQIYMVPGMTVVVEWGWTIDHDNNSVTPNDSLLKMEGGDFFLKNIFTLINQQKGYHQGCYDGYAGVVSNFNYTLNPELGYDCMIELISPAELFLEYAADNTSANAGLDSDTDEKKAKNNFQAVCDNAYKHYKKDSILDGINKDYLPVPLYVKQQWEMEIRDTDYNDLSTTGTITHASKVLLGGTNQGSSEIYISFSGFLDVLNQTIALHPNGEYKRIARNPNPHVGITAIPVTVPDYLYSTDPTISTCNPKFKDPTIFKQAVPIEPEVLAALPWYVQLGIAAENKIGDVSNSSGQKLIPNGQFHPAKGIPSINSLSAVKDMINKIGSPDDKTDIKTFVDASGAEDDNPNIAYLNNFYVNTAYLRDIFDNSVEYNVYDVLKYVLDDLNSVYGGLWKLTWNSHPETPNRIIITDQNYTGPSKGTRRTIKPYEFKLKSGIIREATVESKLVEGFKTLVLYGSNSEPNGVTKSTEVNGQKLYTSNIVDSFKSKDVSNRHIDKLITEGRTLTKEVKKDKTTLESALDEYMEQYRLLLDDLGSDNIDSSKAALAQYIDKIKEKDQQVSPGERTLPSQTNILLPFTFTFKIDGYSGFDWGDAVAFDHLPERYNTKVHFQIISINHNLIDQDWTTEFTTIMRIR